MTTYKNNQTPYEKYMHNGNNSPKLVKVYIARPEIDVTISMALFVQSERHLANYQVPLNYLYLGTYRSRKL